MFLPNLYGTLEKKTGYDVNADRKFASKVDCPYAAVNMKIDVQKTSVRADSSASRGSADEVAATRAVILVPAFVSVGLGDRFTDAIGERFFISSLHPRYSVGGVLDHYELALEMAQ